MSTLPKTPQELKLKRTELNFRMKHGDEGLAALHQYANDCEYVDKIAAHFGVSRARMSQLLNVMLGMPYAIWLAKHGVARKKVTRHDSTVQEVA